MVNIFASSIWTASYAWFSSKDISDNKPHKKLQLLLLLPKLLGFYFPCECQINAESLRNPDSTLSNSYIVIIVSLGWPAISVTIYFFFLISLTCCVIWNYYYPIYTIYCYPTQFWFYSRNTNVHVYICMYKCLVIFS